MLLQWAQGLVFGVSSLCASMNYKIWKKCVNINCMHFLHMVEFYNKAQRREELTCHQCRGDLEGPVLVGSCVSALNWTKNFIKMGEDGLCLVAPSVSKAGVRAVENHLGSVSEAPGGAEPAEAAACAESGRLAASSASCPPCALASSVSFAAPSK